MDQPTIFGIIVAVIVTLLGLLIRYVKPLDPEMSWLEMSLSLIGGGTMAWLFGNLAPFVGFAEPVAAIQWVLVAASVVFSFTELVYNAVKKYFPRSTLARRAFGRFRPQDER